MKEKTAMEKEPFTSVIPAKAENQCLLKPLDPRFHGGDRDRSGEKGAALITALLFLVLLTALGMAAMWTSGTEVLIAGNQYKSKQALYMADAGVQDALSHLDRATLNPAIPALYDENWKATIPTVTINGNTYDVTVEYKKEADPNYDGDGVLGGEIVYYTKHAKGLMDGGFGYPNATIEKYTAGGMAGPVYTITSTGKVAGGNGATATIVADVTENMLNVDSPGGMFSGGCLKMNGNTTITGSTKPGVVTNSTDACDSSGGSNTLTGTNPDGTPATSQTVATTPGVNNVNDGQKISVDTYLGIPISDLKSYETSPQPAATINNGAKTYTFSNAQPAGAFGNQATNTPAIIYIDLSDPTINPTHDKSFTVNAGGLVGYGILVIKGNLKLSGGFNWTGLVIVDNWKFDASDPNFPYNDPNALNTGNVTMDGGGGGVNITGGIMAAGATDTSNTASGGVTVNYNGGTLEDIAKQGFKFKVVTWQQKYN